ncbi:hypothetical protein FB45DRAFT_1092934 [Roridomyces roridus]|uniref:MYND-type domain-containing protein n=1 Tax=Roridomyces roridus TaxID=1738132 RepID=A0AAD7FFP9_9AGAR|nr:hypothetical protein FB45DRAFT_1092934 [Roridomyces roridus]
MHECLRLDALQNLPSSIQRYAQAAASGSTEYLERVVAVMTRPENRSNLIFLLPVVYLLLDPARIPSSDPDHLAALTPAEKAASRDATLAFDALWLVETVPRDVALELWSRVWRWFHFLELYHQVHNDEASERLICSRVVSCADLLERDAEMGPVVRSTPGFYSIAARAWIAALHSTQVSSTDSLEFQYSIVRVTSVARFLNDWMLGTKETLEAFINHHDPSTLAMWALRHGEFALELIRDFPEEQIGFALLLLLPNLLKIIKKAVENLGIHEFPTRLLIALVDEGIIEFLARAATTLAADEALRTIGVDLDLDVGTFLEVLDGLFEDQRFDHVVRKTISGAFVCCVAVCAQQANLPGVYDDLKTLLSVHLASFTIYWGDRSRSGAYVVGALDLYEEMLPDFVPQVQEAWTRFVVLAKERSEFAEAFACSGIVNMKACDNTTCTRLGPKTEFKRCSGCETLYYCSIQCQTVDWHAGHRAACKTHDYQLSGRVPFTTPRQRAFTRAILHRDYTHLKLKIFVEAVTCTRASRDPHAGYFVLFDYSQGGPDIGVYSLAEPSDALDRLAGAGIQWDLTVARAARSGGRMTIHAVRAREGKSLRHWVVPLRSDSGVIHEGLVKMACAVDGEAQVQSINELVAWSNSEVVESH